MSIDALSSADSLRVEAIRAARYSSYAGAMVANLCMAGCVDRTAVWEAEQAVWLRRQNNALAGVTLGRRILSDVVAETSSETYNAIAITGLK